MPKLTVDRLYLFAAAAIGGLCIAGPAVARTVEIPFDANNFSNPIANKFYPLVPGTHTFTAETADGCEVDVVEVTSQTKLINGVQTTVVHDQAYLDAECDGITDDELIEDTFDWVAADNSGNVWYFGEATSHCEGVGTCEPSTGSWEAGKDIQATGSNAQAGILMLADPKSGDRYRQEFYEGFAEDRGMAMNQNALNRLGSVDGFPSDEWENCISTKEWSGLSRGDIEQKIYCEDVGLVLTIEHHGKVVHSKLKE
jgi:hypothetical protein